MPKKSKPSTKPTTNRPRAKPKLLSGGNPQIAKAYGNAPVQEYIAAMPGWKRDLGRRLDAIITRHHPGRSQSRQMELALLRCRRRRLVPQLSLLCEVYQSRFLPRHVVTPGATGRVQAKRSPVPQHLRRRRPRRSSIRPLGEASKPTAGRKDVMAVPQIRWEMPSREQ